MPEDEEEEDAVGVLPAYGGTTLRVCDTCRGLLDPAVPLRVPTGEHYRAGWDLRAVFDDGSGAGGAT